MSDRVALTFDAEHPDRPGAAPGTTERILEGLRAAGVRATFFIQSRWAMANPDLARRIADDGHVVGNHSTYHSRLTLLSDVGLREDIREAGERLADLTGVETRPWFRCPFGDGRDDARVLDAIEELGYVNVHWHVEAEDWEPWRTPEEISISVMEGAAEQGDGAVVLLHTWPSGTSTALPLLLAAFGNADTRFVTVDELESLP